MKITSKKYRMVLGETNDEKFIIEKKVYFLFRKKWSRRYLNGKTKYFYSDEISTARKIVNILNGYDQLINN